MMRWAFEHVGLVAIAIWRFLYSIGSTASRCFGKVLVASTARNSKAVGLLEQLK